MGKQEFEVIDYFGPVVVGLIFAVRLPNYFTTEFNFQITLLLISFFIINFFCITKYDDFTVFEKVCIFNRLYRTDFVGGTYQYIFRI